MMPKLRVENGETTIRTQFNGGYQWMVLTEFEIPEGTWRESLMMTEHFGFPDVHYHEYLYLPGPNGAYRWNHSKPIDGFDEHKKTEEYRQQFEDN